MEAVLHRGLTVRTGWREGILAKMAALYAW
jgi:hypothetical protein